MIPFFSRMFPGTNLQDLNLDWIVRRIMELSKGIIAPWINSQNQHWMVYDTAAETFVDSGVSAAGEGTGPQGEPGKSPVIGNNGNWYTWDTTTQAYTDTGTHAEGPEGPEGPRAGNSLLINGYFVGGGSQQGGGQLPINQRGQTIYSGYGYSIDKWLIGTGLQVESNYITIPAGEYLTQKLEPALFDRLIGRSVTASILLSGNVLMSGTAVISANNDTYLYQSDNVILYMGSVNKDFTVYTVNGLSILAVKLELGAEQTLAHQENGVWVLNEMPDYGDELSKCKRYYQKVFDARSIITLSSAGCEHTFYVPVQMAGVPRFVLENPPTWYRTNGNNYPVTNFAAIAVTSANISQISNSITVNCSIEPSLPAFGFAYVDVISGHFEVI